MDILLNAVQRDFPLVPRPFAAIGEKLGLDEDSVLRRCRLGVQQGTISRVGVVFAPNVAGASTLAAMEVPAGDLERVAQVVSSQPGVNHNYEREHRLNLWFVATAPTQQGLDATLDGIAAATRREVIRLPLLEEFHIDLGFDLAGGAVPRGARRELQPLRRDAADHRLIAAVQGGFPLMPEPFHDIAARAGSSVESVLARLQAWLDSGVARRIGIVVRHRQLGYTANAMAVWDAPDADVSRIGAGLARHAEVTLCYRRARHAPQWPYNLYCMVHGRDRPSVQGVLRRLSREHALEALPQAVLFSVRCFKQCGARYAEAA